MAFITWIAQLDLSIVVLDTHNIDVSSLYLARIKWSHANHNFYTFTMAHLDSYLKNIQLLMT